MHELMHTKANTCKPIHNKTFASLTATFCKRYWGRVSIQNPIVASWMERNENNSGYTGVVLERRLTRVWMKWSRGQRVSREHRQKGVGKKVQKERKKEGERERESMK